MFGVIYILTTIIDPLSAKPSIKSELFQFIRTVQVTPDNNFQNGGFVRVGYVPATNNLIVSFGSPNFKHLIDSLETGYAYKEYNLDMQATGKYGALFNVGGDIGGLIVDNTFYAVSMFTKGSASGWRIVKFDAVTWMKQFDIFFPLDTPNEQNGDPMVAFENGRLDISSQYTTFGGPPPPDQGASTHHQFYSPNLEFLEKMILSDIPHYCGTSMIYVDNIYYLFSSTSYTGDVIVMKYDSDWKYLGMKELIRQAHWPEGVAFDGQRFYVAYLNTSQRTEPGFFPYYPNVHLAAFDREWNLLEDVSVTNFLPSSYMMTGRPWVLMHGNRLFVSYDVNPTDPFTHQDRLDSIQAFVSIYEINPNFSSVEGPELYPTNSHLSQNYPNPFNPSTTIKFSIPNSSFITLKVFNLFGTEITSLVDEEKPIGNYEVEFDGRNLSSGIYFYRMQAGNFTDTKKFILLK